MRTRVKICGITTPEDAESAAMLGADAIGLVFAHGSPRQLDIAGARRIVQTLPPFVASVGLFMDNDGQEIARILGEVELHLLQFHGREPAQACERWGMPYVKALPMGGTRPAGEQAARWPGARAYLLDAHAPGSPGGTGAVFDWARIPARLPGPLVLAGGLNPDNVGEAVRRVRPWAVDVSSGVEATAGRKSAKLMEKFIAAVREADATPGR